MSYMFPKHAASSEMLRGLRNAGVGAAIGAGAGGLSALGTEDPEERKSKMTSRALLGALAGGAVGGAGSYLTRGDKGFDPDTPEGYGVLKTKEPNPNLWSPKSTAGQGVLHPHMSEPGLGVLAAPEPNPNLWKPRSEPYGVIRAPLEPLTGVPPLLPGDLPWNARGVPTSDIEQRVQAYRSGNTPLPKNLAKRHNVESVLARQRQKQLQEGKFRLNPPDPANSPGFAQEPSYTQQVLDRLRSRVDTAVGRDDPYSVQRAIEAVRRNFR